MKSMIRAAFVRFHIVEIRRNISVLTNFRYLNPGQYSKPKCKNITVLKQDTQSQSTRFTLNNKLCMWALSWIGLLNFLGADIKEESELMQILNKAETNIVEKEYDKAELMLHLALRISQQLQNEKSITWVHSRLANVAFETGQYEKAYHLFIDVMKKVVEEGMDLEDLAMIHMSFKLAKILEYQKNYRDAEMGYQFCLDGLKKHIREDNGEHADTLECKVSSECKDNLKCKVNSECKFKDNPDCDDDPECKDAQKLLVMVLTGYAYFHYHLGRWDRALELFLQAYDISTELNESPEERILLLNNLGTVCKIKGDVNNALKYFHQAENLAEENPNCEHSAWLNLNLGYIYLEKNLMTNAKKYCNRAFLISSRSKDESALKEAEQCLTQVNEILLKIIY